MVQLRSSASLEVFAKATQKADQIELFNAVLVCFREFQRLTMILKKL